MNDASQRFELAGPDRVVFGRGTAGTTGERVRRYGDRALVVTDPGIREAGLIDPAVESLGAEGVAVETFDGVEPDPTVSNALECADAVVDAGADAVVGVGGGSSMDVAKAGALLAEDDRPVEELFGRGNVGTPGLPTVLLPTTAGTGSEVSSSCVLYDDRGSGDKVGIVDDAMFASVAVVDPELSMHLPTELTRATGLDAFAHAAGSYVSTTSNPFSDAICLGAMELIETHLRDAAFLGAGAPAAREGMALAATAAMYGRGFGGKAAIHAVAYGIQAKYHLPHGEAIAMVLPEVLEYDLPAAVDDLAALGTRLYGASGGRRDRAEAAIEGVRRLRDDLGMDATLREVGAEGGDREELVDLCRRSERHLEANPRPLDAEGVRWILDQVW